MIPIKKQRFELRIFSVGGSCHMALPPEIRNAIGIDMKKDKTVIAMLDESKHGTYLAVFKK
jgi:hypothetical protein